MGKVLCPVACIMLKNTTTDTTATFIYFTAIQEVGEYLPVLPTCQRDSELKKAEGLIETRMAWDDFTVGWQIL